MTAPYTNGSGTHAAIAGHPLHPFIVPLPIGALLFAFVSDIAFYYTGDPQWSATSYFLLCGGVATALLAAVLGMIETMGVKRARTMGLVWAHAILNVLAVIVAFVSILLRNGGATDAAGFNLAMTGPIAVGLLVSGWIGGEISYKHGVGVAETVGSDRPDNDLERDAFGRPDVGKA
jgi:uncharacterized membrane protein